MAHPEASQDVEIAVKARSRKFVDLSLPKVTTTTHLDGLIQLEIHVEAATRTTTTKMIEGDETSVGIPRQAGTSQIDTTQAANEETILVARAHAVHPVARIKTAASPSQSKLLP